MRKVALLPTFASLLLLAACTRAPAPNTTEADTATIRAITDHFVAAWNRGDTAALAPLVAGDIILMQPDGPSNVGRDAVLHTMAQGYNIAVMQQTAKVDEVTVSGGYGYAFGSWNVNPKPGASADVQARHGKWSALYKRQADGAWQLWRWMWNQDGAPLAAGG